MTKRPVKTTSATSPPRSPKKGLHLSRRVEVDDTTLFHRQSLHAFDPVEAAENAQERALKTANDPCIKRMTILESIIPILGEKISALKAKIKDLKNRLKATPKKVSHNTAQPDGSSARRKFRSWRTSDKIAIVSLLSALVVMLVTGVTNAYVAIMASAEPVIVDNPMLAVLLAMVVMGSSMAIKFFGNIFHDPRSKKRYSLGLYILTVIFVLAWAVVFSMEFGGITEGVSLDDLDGDSGGKGSNLLVFIQLATEVLVAAALAMAAEDLYNKYDKDTEIANKDYDDLAKELAACEKELAEALEKHANYLGELAELRNKRDKQLIEEVTEFNALQGGFGVVRRSISIVDLIKNGLIVILALLLGMSLSDNADAKTLVVGVSPYMNEATYQVQSKELLLALTEKMELGDEAVFIDAYQLQVIGRYSLPNKSAYRSAKARLKYNARVAKALINWPKTVPAAVKRPQTPGAVKLPQFLRYIALNHAGAMDEKGGDILILGSPYYDVPEDEVFSMAAATVPGDGHLKASRAVSVYGAADFPELLRGWRVHQVYGKGFNYPSDRVEFAVERWWVLYVEAMGGVFSTFTRDIAPAVDRALSGAKAPPHNHVPEDTERLQMIHLYVDDQTNALPIQERPLTVTPIAQSSVTHAENVTIGLSWQCACDLDLFARPHAGADILSFAKHKTTEGRYYQDVQGKLPANQATSEQGMETIVFSKGVDLTQLQIVVGFYSGNAPGGVQGELRIGIGDKTYAHRFNIPASKGNKANMVKESFAENKARADHIAVIDPLKVIRVSQ
ncbi:hypothetical protein QSV34_10620 [Porticoccus sp. W117]|uniref:hypothetical protein n=1 Tax=Porticoccus sp. W117 TaxID=3054777 RepID=UPI0025920E6B|nr:hypothetical protein [Porticoccus sp. W117]MDM3871804.1 hypothetical protein [Porticoccus sp. W117]